MSQALLSAPAVKTSSTEWATAGQTRRGATECAQKHKYEPVGSQTYGFN